MAKMRLDKLLSNMGYGSRSEIKLGVKKRFACVNGQIAKDPGVLIDPERDQVTWTGILVSYKASVCLMLNKPAGIISATEDPRDKTVLDLLDPPFSGMALFPVGRLDKDTEGLLLLTNDGDLAHRLLSPKKKVPKTYRVTLDRPLSAEGTSLLEAGIPLEEGFVTSPAQVEFLEGNGSEVLLTIYEGRFHQVKRMMHFVGCEVVYLKRMNMGNLKLDSALEPGSYREMTEAEPASNVGAGPAREYRQLQSQEELNEWLKKVPADAPVAVADVVDAN